MTRFIVVEPCNFIDFPIGGQLSFVRQLMQVFGNEIALVGYTHPGEPSGMWYKKRIDNIEYDYFGIYPITKTDLKPRIPLRIQNLFWFWKNLKKVLNHPCSNWFIQAPEILLATSGVKSVNIAYMFPGVENPLEMPRYRWGRLFSNVFYQRFLKQVQKADIIYACADEEAIEDLRFRANGLLSGVNIIQFPTRYNSDIFFPIEKENAREKLGISKDDTIFVCNGRINSVKGWDLILAAFNSIQRECKNSQLIFIGDGEDRDKLLNMSHDFNLENKVSVTGFQSSDNVALYLNCCDVVLVGSEREGWSVSMLEALACAKPVVSTAVSGANTMIINGKNGYIVSERDPNEFAKKAIESNKLTNASSISTEIASKYAISTLKSDLLKTWEHISSE